LIPVASLGLPEPELEALFAEAEPLSGRGKIVEPAPHHALLILARRLSREPRLLPKHHARIERALLRDPAAWAQARSRADLWGAERALARLSRLHADGDPRRVHRRLRAPRPRRNRVIALSSVSGEQAAWHAEALQRTLARLGFDTVVDRPLSNLSTGTAPGLAGVLELALSLWRPVWRHPVRGRVLIYGSSALDVAASLSARETTRGTLSRSSRLLRRLAPTPLRSYVIAQAAAAPDRPPADGGQAAAYHAAAGAFGARLLDGERPSEDLCEEIAEDVWGALTRRTTLVSALRRLLAPADRRRAPTETAGPPSA
jgi:hypothetical protein